MAVAAPTNRGNVVVLEPPSVPAEPGGRRRAARFRPRVLLVEPEVEARLALVMGLAEAGFEVLALDTRQALEVELGQERVLPHLVLLSAEAAGQGVDVYELCARVRGEPRTEHVPVFLLAARPEEHLERAREVGVDACLGRPLSMGEVVGLAWLHAGRSAAAYEAHSQWLPLSRAVGLVLAGRRSGRVELRDGRGSVRFHQGQVVEASWEGATGEVALRRLLLFGAGAYAVCFTSEPEVGSLALGLEPLRTRVLPGLERFARLRQMGVPLEARLVLNAARLEQERPALAAQLVELARWFDGRRTVQTVLMECGQAEVTVLEDTTRLYTLGVLDPAPSYAELR